eukprot:scpid69985/ scgid27513/ 
MPHRLLSQSLTMTKVRSPTGQLTSCWILILTVILLVAGPARGQLPLSKNGWDLFMDTGRIVIRPQDAQQLQLGSFDCTAFTIQNRENADVINADVQRHRLSAPCSPRLLDAVTVEMTMNTLDLDAVKLNQGLATGQDGTTTFLSVRANSGIVDVTKGSLESVPSSAGRVGNLFQDSIAPAVISFQLFDLDSGELSLVFDEPVNLLGALNVSASAPSLRLQHHVTSLDSLEYFDVRQVTPITGNGRNVTVRLSDGELNRLKLMRRVCSSIADCWITLSEFFVADMAGNRMSPLSNGVTSLSRLLSSFIVDDSGPVLQTSSINFNNGMLVLSFNEPIDSASISPSAISVMSAPNANTSSALHHRQLTGGRVLSGNGQRLSLLLDAADLNALKSSDLLATDRNNTYLSINGSLASDLALTANPVRTVSVANASKITTYTGDTVPPQVSAFTIDFERSRIVITWDE